MDRIFRYWGKADGESSGGPAWHLLAYHCLDVAAMAAAWLEAQPTAARWLGRCLGMSDAAACRLAAYLAALHDVGKFADSFQRLMPDIQSALQGRLSDWPYVERHDLMGCGLMAEDLSRWAAAQPWFERWGLAGDVWLPLAATVACHHGKPVNPGDPRATRAMVRRNFRDEDRAAATEFAGLAADLLLGAPPDVGVLGLRQAMHASWFLSGLTTLADWSASGGFPFVAEQMPLGEYWGRTRRRAGQVLAAWGLRPPGVSAETGLGPLFPAFAETPSPLQAWADEVPLAAGPQLFILEDVTGAGKTEAALTLAHRLMGEHLAEGLYIGLPTMATANGIFRRIKGRAARFFPEGSSPSLVLAHGARELVPEFRTTILAQNHRESIWDDDPGADGERPATVMCNAWLADNRKKTLLADIGVGTIDQALLAVLHSRHQSLRLLGLARRVLIVDEVHAYDAYMSRLLQRLLTFQAALGGSAILLSATLPQGMRNDLAAAFAEGVGGAAPALAEAAYPLATQLSADTIREVPMATRAEVSRAVAVELIHSEAAADEVVLAAARAGLCVCWVRNTVADAVAACQRLRVVPDLQGRVMLFHARFALGDRLRIEDQVLARFGKGDPGQPVERAGRVLVATQVVEQSLDLDFDAMVSDLAPIDLLVQRAGRIKRHVRGSDGRLLAVGASDQRGLPRLHVLAPEPVDAPAAGWLKTLFPRAAGVYPHHGHLWRTARLFRPGGRAGWRMPEDARGLIEGVFGDQAEPIPPGLDRAQNEAEGKAFADAALALANALDVDAGYWADAHGVWLDDVRTPTRLGEASSNVLLLRRTADGLAPWIADGEDALRLSQVQVAARLLRQGVKPEGMADGDWATILEGLPSFVVPLVLESAGDVWTGAALDGLMRRRRWTYDEILGLRLAETEA